MDGNDDAPLCPFGNHFTLVGFDKDQQQYVRYTKSVYKRIKKRFETQYLLLSGVGGCFWGMKDLFRVRPGVEDTAVGYLGGQNDHPTYKNHPGHAEGIEITYDPNETSYEELLDYFFRVHDPTTVDRQGNDRGASYRSAIFIQYEKESEIAKTVIKIVDDSGRWSGNVVTTLEPYTKFWPAEENHQDYLIKHPNGYTCHFERFDTFL